MLGWREKIWKNSAKWVKSLICKAVRQHSLSQTASAVSSTCSIGSTAADKAPTCSNCAEHTVKTMGVGQPQTLNGVQWLTFGTGVSGPLVYSDSCSGTVILLKQWWM